MEIEKNEFTKEIKLNIDLLYKMLDPDDIIIDNFDEPEKKRIMSIINIMYKIKDDIEYVL